MDNSVLDTKFLEWEKLNAELIALEDEIKTIVLKMGKTRTVGNVTVFFSNGRKTFNYKVVGNFVPQEIVDKYTSPETD